ncbi:hypothetical protein ACF0H5_009827 [Mactra antiquata]
MAEGGDPLRPIDITDDDEELLFNFQDDKQERPSRKTRNVREVDGARGSQKLLSYGARSGIQSPDGKDSFYNRVTPPDGHSRLHEFQSVELISDSFNENISLGSLVDPGEAFGIDTVYNVERRRKHNEFGSDTISTFSRSVTSRCHPQRIPSFTDECPAHEGESIKYVCRSCDNALLCQVCLTLKHSKCIDREFINTVVNDPSFEFIEKWHVFEDDLNNIEQRIRSHKSKVKTNTKLIASTKNKALADLMNHRITLSRLFDKLGRQVENELKSIENGDYEKMDIIKGEVTELERDFNNLVADFELRKEEGKRSKLYTKMVMSQEDIDKFKNKLAELEGNNYVKNYRYQPTDIMNKLTEDDVKIGTASAIDFESTDKLHEVSNIPVAHDKDNNKCKITGLALLSENNLVAVDSNNSSIKIIDIVEERVSDVYHLKSQPLDVIVIANDPKSDDIQLLVTFPLDCKIMSFSIEVDNDVLKEVNTIHTKGNCRGVVCFEGNLVVTFPLQGKIEVLSFTGDVLKRITNDTIGHNVFIPQFVAMDMSGGRFYVSDRHTHGVLVIDDEGVVQEIYTSVDMLEPRGLGINEDGTLYVCSLSGHQIHHISENAQYLSNHCLKDDEQLTPFPHCLVRCNTRNVLYVGQLSYDCVKAYKLSS